MTCVASRIIDKCGGFRAVSRITGRSENQVRKWTYSRERGGTGGLIPAQFQQRLVEATRFTETPITPDDFFDLPEAGEDAA